jgi:hypothetical protein
MSMDADDLEKLHLDQNVLYKLWLCRLSAARIFAAAIKWLESTAV